MQLARIVGLGLLVAAVGATGSPLERRAVSPERIAAPASVIIPCDQSPFGKAAPLVRDLEPMVLMRGVGKNYFDEYRPSENNETPPLQRVYRADLLNTLPDGLPFRKAVSVDLNGDGRDEVVAAYSTDTSVLLAVFSRTAGPNAQVIDTWVYDESLQPDSIEIVAGDFDGSHDGRREIAVNWKVVGGPNNARNHLVFLKGDANAHIAQANGATAGSVLGFQAPAGALFTRLAAGDFMLSGRDQVVLAEYLEVSAAIELELVEFNDTGNGTLALPQVGLQATRFAHFESSLDGTFINGHVFAVDDAPAIAMKVNLIGTGVVEGLDVDAGDMVDTAAAELAVHVMFPEPVSPASHVLGQRVIHFATTRDINNAITGVSLGGGSKSFDSSIMLERYPGNAGPQSPPKFSATVADVDGIAGKEIVTARAGHDGSGGSTDGSLKWFATKVVVRNVASFQWQNQGVDGGTSQPIVTFINNSLGGIAAYDWDFGDGSPHSGEANPVHRYNTAGSKTVKLIAAAYDNSQVTYQHSVDVNGGNDANPQGDAPPPHEYKIDPQPVFTGTADPDFFYSTYGTDHTAIKIDVGDLNRDGLPDVVISVNNDASEVETHVFKRQADGSFGRTTKVDPTSGIDFLDMVLSDFDGDSLNAVLSGVSGDCRSVADKAMRSLTYMPPYFSTLQANSNRATRYGKSTSNSSSAEEHSASYTSHSITAYLGASYELDVPVLAIKLAEVEAKASLGYNFQLSQGALHGDEYEYSIDQGFSLGDDDQSIDQEGLITTEQNSAECYSYNLVTANGIVPGSAMRSCRITPGQKVVTAPGVADWNRLATEPAPISVPIHWVPVQRDWASLALFHVPTAGSSTGGISFTDASHGANKATDGLFDTAAESLNADKPYLDIDLGSVHEIDSVRVFPSADPPSSPGAFEPIDFKQAVKDLAGFRLYASATPFIGNNPPTAAAFTTFVPNGISTFVQDTGVEAVYRVWNVWTENRGTSSNDPNAGQPLHARYLRLQKPVSGRIRIAEIQVFGNTHAEPKDFPDAVCDDRVGDGLFKAQVYDTVNHAYRVIQVRGDMIWTGAVDYISNVLQPTGVTGCVNDTTDGNSDSASPDTVRQEPIWQDIGIGDAGSADWSLNQNHTHTEGKDASIDSAVHVGTEFEAKLGAGVQVVVGASYEFNYGVTKDVQSSLATGTGFTVSGTSGGFADQSLADVCRYFPRPYAFKLTNYSNTGFRHDSYVTDYVIRQKGRAGAWQREAIPLLCWDGSDRIFADNFD